MLSELKPAWSAWASANGIVSGQRKTAEKSNEITALSDLLELSNVSGCIVTIDAMGCQTRIAPHIRDRRITEQTAMQAVMETEIRLGHSPRDVSADNLGYDIESRDGETGLLRFIEVKGRRAGAETVTVTYNEIRALCNRPDTGILALAEVDDDGRAHPPRYVRRAFDREPHFSVVSVNYNRDELLAMSEEPEWWQRYRI